MYQPPPTKKEVVAALQALEGIERPEGDNEGCSINSKEVYRCLSSQEQELVDRAEKLAKEYIRESGDIGFKPKSRSITELNKAGFPTSLYPDQYDLDRLVGRVEVGDWELDVSDRNNQTTDD